MRFYEIASGLRVPVNEEEQHLIDLAVERRQLRDSDLDERHSEVARLMVTRGLLLRDADDEGSFYAPNGAGDLWRF